MKKIVEIILQIWRFRKIISPVQFMRLMWARKKASNSLPIPIKFRNYSTPFFIRPGTTDATIFYHVFLLHDYPPITLQNRQKKITIIDAGANIGAATFFFKIYNPEATIIAIEPDEGNCQIFELNTKSFSNVFLLKAALFNEDHKTVKIENPEAGSMGFRVKPTDEQSAIKTVSINHIVDKYKIKNLDVVKIDIEGGEKAVFEKNTEWLDISNRVMVELHDHYVFGCSSSIINAFSNRNIILSKNGENFIFTNIDIQKKYNL